MRWISLLAALALSAAAAAAAWWVADRPVPVAAEWRQPLASVSFAPFRRGESPLTKMYPTRQQIERDLAALVGRAAGLRTYTAREGLEVVPELAARLGLKVTFSAWLGGEAATNDAELTALITAANKYPEAIQRVIVGNEVLLRRDLPPDKLIAAIRRVKAAVRQPVSTADVWAYYLKYPEVAREVDFLTIHILPFWEDQPVAVDRIEPYVVGIVAQLRQAFPGKPILIGESGWPSLGRDRGSAVVDVVNEASFVRQMANIAARHGFDYNIVEAFDQPWKSALEGTVGAAWGILDEARHPKFAMTGPVPMVADWPLRAGYAIALGVLASLALSWRLSGFRQCLTLALAAQILAWLLVTTLFHVEAVIFGPKDYAWAVLRIGLPAVLFIAMLTRCRDWLAKPDLALQGALASAEGAPFAINPWRGQGLMLFCALYAMVWTALLLFDGRYRDIPEFDFAVPVGGLAVMLGLRLTLTLGQGGQAIAALCWDGLFPGSHRRAIRLLAWCLPLAALAALTSEGVAVIGEDFRSIYPALADRLPVVLTAMIANREMNLWAAMLMLWGLPFALARRTLAREAAMPA